MCLIEPSYGHTGRFGIAIWMSPEMSHEGAPHAIDISQIALKTLFVEEGMLHGEFRMHTVLTGLGGWCLLDLAFLEYDLDHIRTGVPSGTFPMPSGMCARAQWPRGPVSVTPCAEAPLAKGSGVPVHCPRLYHYRGARDGVRCQGDVVLHGARL